MRPQGVRDEEAGVAVNVRCSGCRKNFPYFEDPGDRPWADCPACHSLTKVGERPKLAGSGLGGVRGDSDRWNPWVPGLTPMDTPRMKEWEAKGWVRRNPVTGQREGFCPTHADYARRVKQLGYTTDWMGQGNRANRREAREEWREERPSQTKTYFT